MLFGLINPKRRIAVRGLSSTSYKIEVDTAKKVDQANEGDTLKKEGGKVTITGHVDEGKVDDYVVDGSLTVVSGDIAIETEKVIESRLPGVIALVVVVIALVTGAQFLTE